MAIGQLDEGVMMEARAIRIASLPAEHKACILREDVQRIIYELQSPLGYLLTDSYVFQHVHLVAWTAPGSQVRISAVHCRESAPQDHHHLATAFVSRFGKQSKRSQRIDLRENRVMHRQEVSFPYEQAEAFMG